MVNLITHLIFRSIIKIFVPLTSLNCFIFQKEVAVYSPKIEINPKSIFYFELKIVLVVYCILLIENISKNGRSVWAQKLALIYKHHSN